MEWSKKTTVKKGALGEMIVRQALESKGYIVYEPKTKGAHPFDLLAVKDKRVFVIAEVKTKARLNNWEATGINVSHYNDYIHVMEAHNIDVVLCFVDEHPSEKRVYGQRLSELIKEHKENGIDYPNFDILKKRNIVMIPLSKMITISNLDDHTVTNLMELSTRSHDYE